MRGELRAYINSDFIKEVRDFKLRHPGPMPQSDDWSEDSDDVPEHNPIFEAVPRIAERHGVGIIGHGAERVILPYPNDPTKIVAIHYGRTSPVIARLTYYSHRFFHHLFPQHFPRTYAIFGSEFDDRDRPSGSIRQRIYPNEPVTKEQILDGPFKRLARECTNLGIFLRLDYSRGNFMNGTDGNFYYLEEMHSGSMPFERDRGRIENYIAANGFPSSQERHVLGSFDTFFRLQKDFYRNLGL